MVRQDTGTLQKDGVQIRVRAVSLSSLRLIFLGPHVWFTTYKDVVIKSKQTENKDLNNLKI